MLRNVFETQDESHWIDIIEIKINYITVQNLFERNPAELLD